MSRKNSAPSISAVVPGAAARSRTPVLGRPRSTGLPSRPKSAGGGRPRSGTGHGRSRSFGGSRENVSTAAMTGGGGNGGGNGGGGGGGGGGATIEFHNFTPLDGSRILSGVAPSGSSKTKARREREAAERRRRLGRAAVRAVERAGGD
ncbi:hypothetical protein V492_08059, partial [Pseudogymnoascus sp. VKM F-4246]